MAKRYWIVVVSDRAKRRNKDDGAGMIAHRTLSDHGTMREIFGTDQTNMHSGQWC